MKFWSVIPAGGVGARMGTVVPKQYLPLGGSTVLGRTIARLGNHPRIEGVAVAVAAGDERWCREDYACSGDLLVAEAGAERCYSVLSALRCLAGVAAPSDWVLVHDAARPCLRSEDVDRLIEQLADHPVGGLLGVPVRDTMKRAAGNVVMETVPREGLWHALTPQMFRLQPLMQAVEKALADGIVVTDEAQAMELQGLRPVLVEGHADNIKITMPRDLALAELYLQQQEQERTACV